MNNKNIPLPGEVANLIYAAEKFLDRSGSIGILAENALKRAVDDYRKWLVSEDSVYVDNATKTEHLKIMDGNGIAVVNSAVSDKFVVCLGITGNPIVMTDGNFKRNFIPKSSYFPEKVRLIHKVPTTADAIRFDGSEKMAARITKWVDYIAPHEFWIKTIEAGGVHDIRTSDGGKLVKMRFTKIPDEDYDDVTGDQVTIEKGDYVLKMDGVNEFRFVVGANVHDWEQFK